MSEDGGFDINVKSPSSDIDLHEAGALAGIVAEGRSRSSAPVTSRIDSIETVSASGPKKRMATGMAIPVTI